MHPASLYIAIYTITISLAIAEIDLAASADFRRKSRAAFCVNLIWIVVIYQSLVDTKRMPRIEAPGCVACKARLAEA